MRTINGQVSFSDTAGGPVHIAALAADGSVLDETQADAQGRWSLASVGVIDTIVAYTKANGVAAVAAAATQSASLVLPPRHECSFELLPTGESILLWIDPVSLVGVLDRGLPALRLHPNATVDLHVGEFAAPSGGAIRVHLQSGRYRITGGRMSLRPLPTGTPPSLAVASILDKRSGRTLTAAQGEVILDVSAAGDFRVVFAAVP